MRTVVVHCPYHYTELAAAHSSFVAVFAMPLAAQTSLRLRAVLDYDNTDDTYRVKLDLLAKSTGY